MNENQSFAGPNLQEISLDELEPNLAVSDQGSLNNSESETANVGENYHNDNQEFNYIAWRRTSLDKKMNFISTAPTKFKLKLSELQLLPFSEKIFYREEKSATSEPSARKWLVCCNTKLYCTVCMCFSSEVNWFVKGLNDFRRVSQYLKKHEKSSNHNICVETYLRNSFNCNINAGLPKMVNIRKTEIDNNRSVLDAILNILKFLSKQGLAIRGKQNESIANINNIGNHGNFLELIKLVAIYNPTLTSHLNKCLERSKNSNRSNNGRGGLVTFLSKTTINKLFGILRNCVVEQIVNEINMNGGKFGIECDTTQDVGTKDQAAIVVRYVNNCSVEERLVAFKHSKDGTGNGMYSLIKDSLGEIGLKTGKSKI